MKSQRRQTQSRSRKNSRQNQQRNKNKSKNQNQQRNNQNQQRNNQNQQRNNQNQQRNNRNGKASQKNSKQSKRNTRSQKRLQRQRNSRNSRVTRKNQRSQKQKQKQRKNRAKKSQSGGYGSWSLAEIQSIIPCNTVTSPDGQQISVPDFESSADAASKICSETVDILDAEHGADDSVTVISDLSPLTLGGTTQVINEEGIGGDGRTLDQTQHLLNRVAKEARYQELGRMVAPNPTRNATEQAKFEELGEHATRRWNHLVRAGYAGPGTAFPSPVATSQT